MGKLTEQLKALHMDKAGQATATGAILGLLIVLIFVAIVALVISNVLAIAGLTTGLWTLDDLLLSVGFVVVLISFIGVAGTLFLTAR